MATKSTVADTVDFVAGFGDKSATTWIRQLVAVDVVANSVDFVADTVDRVEFNLVLNVYRALEYPIGLGLCDLWQINKKGELLY